MKQRVLILGAGFGGLELATRLSETIPDAVDVTLIDRNDAFVFGFSKLEVMMGRRTADEIRLPYREIRKPSVEFRQETITTIDPVARRVTTDAGSYDADFLVVALGADYDMAATPGLEEGGHEYYTVAGAERLRDALADFRGGKVLVSILGQPFKCPPAPFEGSFLLHELFTQKGIRDDVQMTTTFPMKRPVPVTGEVSQMFHEALADRHVTELPEHLVTSIEPATRTAHLADGETLPYDLFIGIPVLREGNILELAGQKLSVVEACSGIRSLLTLSFLSLVYGYFFERKIWMRVLLFVATVPIAILANASRVTLTGILSEIKPELAHGFFHSASGWVIFMVALLILAVVHQTADRFYRVIRARG